MATNISAATALAITASPYTLTLDARTTAQPFHEVWWSYHATECIGAITITAHAVSGSTYNPTVAVFTGTPSSLTPYGDSGEQNAQTRAYSLPVITGATYYVRVRSASQNNDLDSDLSLLVTLTSNTVTVAAGSLAVTYSSSRPLELRSSATGAVIQTVSPFEHATAGAQTLNDGTVMVNTYSAASVEMYDADLLHLRTVAFPGFQISTNGVDRFYIANFVGNLTETAVVRAISSTGLVVQTWTMPDDFSVDTGSLGFYGMAPSPDDTILYLGGPPIGYQDGDPDVSTVIRRFSLASSTYLSDLNAPLATSPHLYYIADIIVMPNDGSVIAMFARLVGGVDSTIVLHYSSAGSLLNTYNLGDGSPGRLARIPGDTTAFWAHTVGEGGVQTSPDRFRKIQIADGSVLVNFTTLTSLLPLEHQGGQFWVLATAHAACVPTPVPPPLPPPPIPPPPPTPGPGIPEPPCTPKTHTGNGGTGHAGCNTGGTGYIPWYPGPFGTVPQHPDPVPGESMVNAKGVDLWVEIVHEDYPSGARTTHRRAMVDLADAPSYQGGLKSGGLLGVGDVEHGLGNEQGGFEAATVDISYADSADRLFRNLLLNQELEGDEVRIKLATIQGRLNEVAPRVIARAVAQKPKLSSALNASFSASDYLFSEFGPFGPGRQFPSWLMPESIFPYASADSLKLPIPVLYGEKSDHGAIDPITGVFNSKGLVPLIYMGPTSLETTAQAIGVIPPNDPTVDPPPESEVNYLFTPVGQLSFQASEDNASLLRYDVKLYTSGTVTPVLATLDIGKPTPDASGTIRVALAAWLNARPPGVYDVTVTAVSGTGSGESGVSNTFTVPLETETGSGTGGWFGPIDTTPFFAVMTVYNGHASRLVLKNGPNIRVDVGTPHNFRVTWTEAPQAAEYYVFMYMVASWDAYTNPYVDATVRYKRVPAVPPNSQDSNWDYYADWTSPADGAAWPPVVDTGTSHADVWDTYVLCGHAIFDIIEIFGSDLGNGDANAEQQRILLDPNTRGDILCPFFATWPFPTTYRDFTADDGSVYRMTVIYARGPLSDAHKNGVINMTVNALGVEDAGDGSGLPLIDAHAIQQHWIENFLINNYRTGLWATNSIYPQWDDGTAMVRSSAFARLQAFGLSRIGGRGLTVGWYIGDQKVLQEWFREWNTSTDSRLGINGDGQIVVDALDETVDTSMWPRVLHETDLFGDVIITSGEERENVVSGVCDWDPDTKAWRGPTITYESQHAIAQYKGRRKQGTTVESTILISERQMRWVLLRRLTRLQDGTKMVELTGKVDLLDYDVGTGILLTTIEGTGTGYVDKPLLILRRRFKVAERLVTLTLLDLDTFLVPLDQVFNIGDDTISLPTGNPVGGGGGNPGGGGGGGNPGGGGGPGGGVNVGLPVVPGAAGWGMETRAAYGAGTNPTVYRVNSLADSGSGSLREALEATGPRLVVFETSGYVTLNSMITITSPYLTVAGQTAPSPGIAVKNYGIIIDTHDVLLQHFRVRPGGDTCNNAIECFSANVYNVVLDHMSVSWGQDENIVFYNPSRPINATAWMCITAEGLHNTPGTSGCPGGGTSPSHGMLIYSGAQRVTVARTLFALNVERNPYAQGDTIVGYYNNLVYAWSGEEGFLFANFDTSGNPTGGPWHATAIGNRFIPGPDSDDMFGYSDNGGAPLGNTIYRSDNTASSAITNELNDLGYDPNVSAPPSQSPVPTGYAPMPSIEMETLILNNSGARPTDRDGVDQRILDAVHNRTGTYVVHQDDVGGWPALAVHTRTLTLPANPHTVLVSGYTNLEVWLHQYADVVEGTTTAAVVSN